MYKTLDESLVLETVFPVLLGMRISVFLFLWLFCAGSLRAQYNFYYGKVYDEVTRKPLSNVNLSVLSTRIGTVTNRKGEFSFFTDSIPATLVITHVGYQTKTVVIDQTSFSMVLYLLPEMKELPEVEIRANAHEAFFRHDQFAVMDYEIDSGLVYLLIYRQRLANGEVICKRPEGDTVARSAVCTFAPNKLFRDCMGYMHLLSSDSGFQIHRRGEILTLVHPVSLKRFDDVLKNCVVATSTTIYFRKVTDHGLGVEYYGVDRKTLARRTVSTIVDQERAAMLRRNEEDAGLLWKTRQPDSRDDFVTWNYVQKILYRPIKSAIFRIGGYICIFNTPDRQMEFYDPEGNYSYKISIQSDKVNDGRWTTEIYIDEKTAKVYTSFLRNGSCSIYSINLNTGELKKRVTVLHAYPEKINIYNGYIYYLYDVAGDPDNKMLFKQRL
jgi:hypothetical protein